MHRIDRPAAWFAAALLIATLLPLLHPQLAPRTVNNVSVEWAEPQWAPPDSSPVRLRLSALEQRFARQFPGHIAHFADERHEWIVRVVEQPTRMLHPATDCFRAIGYAIGAARVRADAAGEQWRCFSATGKGKTFKVCERIFDAGKGRWTDTSAWYWSALTGNAQQGPWWAVTRVEIGE